MRNKLLKFIIWLTVVSTISMCTLKKEHARAVKHHKQWQDSVNALRTNQLSTDTLQSYQEWKRDQDRDSAWKKVMSK